MADTMVADGWLDLGYEFVAMDDCWLATERDAHGRLQPDHKRFPSGMKALADYVRRFLNKTERQITGISLLSAVVLNIILQKPMFGKF